MTEWVALLRGVNVGGISIKSADLVELFRGLGFDEVSTVLASGNVCFATDAASRGALKRRIEGALRDRFAYDAWILLVTRGELATAAEGFPFDATDAARQPWVIFCADGSTVRELVEAAASLDDSVDPVAAGDEVIYWSPQKGRTTDTPFAKVIAKSTYRARTTNRNLRTLLKILG